jgi:HSP20 family molecular chaperone IbpA
MRTDIKENGNGFELDIDLPGYKKEDVKAQLKDGYLTISAENSQSNDEKDSDGKYIRRERFFGTCSRSFYVGDDITEEDIKAKFENGILKVSVPKKEAKPVEEKNKFISIEG